MKKSFSARRIVLIAVFSALAYVVSLFEFPIFPATPFLKIDFGNVFIMLVGFLLGPIDAILACIVKEFLYFLVGSDTGGVGQVANFLMTSSYILLPAIAYRLRKGLKIVIPSLIVAGVIATVVALLTNRFILFPLYGIANPKEFFAGAVWYLVAFNLIKTTAISVLTLLLYKRLSNFIKGMKLETRNSAKSEKIRERKENVMISESVEQTQAIAMEYAKTLKAGDVVLLDGDMGAGKTAFAKGIALGLGDGIEETQERKENIMISNSVEQTQAIAMEYAKTLKAGDIVLLDGDMGAGKTAFSKGVALGLGIEEEVTSPTYAYMNDYDGRLFHYDCYRIESVEQAENLGLADYFDMGGICLIEWSQNIAPLLPSVVKRVRITKIDETKREIEL